MDDHEAGQLKAASARLLLDRARAIATKCEVWYTGYTVI
jgi:hypothetical protein